MNTRTETDEILNELTSIEFDDDDALTLLDDEEAAPVSKNIMEDEDLASFYSDSVETLNSKPKEDVVVEKIEAKPVVRKEVPKVEEKKVEHPKMADKYQGSMESRANLDAYLSGALDAKKEEVKVEKITLPPTPPKEPLVEEKVEPIEPPKLVPSTIAQKKEEQVNIDSLNQLFEKVSSNVRGASDIVNKNAEIKKKIDEKFQELKRLQEEHEKNKENDYAEINAYKEDVYAKLKEKKTEVEEQMAILTQAKASFEKEKENFEKDKEAALLMISKREQDLDKSYHERLQGISQIEDGLVKRKEQLDLERASIQQERAQCDKEKKELADNLLKFNQLVDDFTRGVDRFSDSN